MDRDGPAIWRRACQLGLEGIVSKRAESKYASGGRGPYWIKVPCRQRDTFAIVGWANKNGKFDGIYLGKTQNGALVYAGKLERGFSEEDKRTIHKRLAPLMCANSR